MNPIMIALAVTFVVGSTSAFAQGPALSKTLAENVAWMDTPFGVQASPVFGDFTTGKHITLIKFAAGTRTPMHVHSRDYVGVVVQGRGIHFEPGDAEAEQALEPGATWTVPADVPHVSGCLEGQDCIFALYQDAAFDYLPRD